MPFEFRSASALADELTTFVASWSAADRRQRFGIESASAGDWLTRSLTEGRSLGIVALLDGRVAGLLDFNAHGAPAEFGVFVAAERRRQGLARTLFAHLLARRPTAEFTADCRADNPPALALLRALGFRVSARSAGELHWERAKGGEITALEDWNAAAVIAPDRFAAGRGRR